MTTQAREEVQAVGVGRAAEAESWTIAGEAARRRLVAAMPVKERRLDLAGISTAILEGGDGPPVVLLHGPAAYAAHWMQVVPGLVATHRVVATDLPGHGASEVMHGALDASRMREWLGELIQRTCGSAPTLVGQLLGGAIAARFAADRSERLAGLVLIDSFGLGDLQLPPEFAQALAAYQTEPTESTHEGLWRFCTFDLDRMRHRMGELWAPFETYNIDRARTPGQKAALPALMATLGMPAIAPADLGRIAVPTTLICGRYDLATLPLAEAASARYGWPLHVIEDAADDPPVEQPEATLAALRAVLKVR